MESYIPDEVKSKSLSRVPLFATPWTIQSMEFSRPEYWSEVPLPSPIHSVFLGFPCGSAGKESACNTGNLGSDPWVGNIPWRRERLLNISQCSDLENSMDCIVHGVAKSGTGLSDFNFQRVVSSWGLRLHLFPLFSTINTVDKHVIE